jgi:hypothetical protein
VVSEVPVVHQRRKFGRSKYGVARFVSGFFDLMTVIMLTRYNRKPLHAFGVFGLVLLGLGSAVLIYLTAGWFSGHWIGDRPAFMLAILFLIVGVQFIFFGLLAEMIAYASKREEAYSIKRIVGGREAVASELGEDLVEESTVVGDPGR